MTRKFTRKELSEITGEFNLSLNVHPAIADHPFNNGEKLYDKDGLPVPLITDQCSVCMDGRLIGYVMSDLRVSLIVPRSQLTDAVVDAINAMVSQLGDVPAVNAIAPLADALNEDDE